MNKGAGPTRARIAPDPTKRPVPMAPPRALESCQYCDPTKIRILNIQKLDVSTLQSTVCCASSSSSPRDRRMAVDKRFFVGCALAVVVCIRTLLRVCAVDDLVVRHVGGRKG
jgi:hypothetical protein